MLRQNGGCNVVVAAPEGLKMELAKKLGAGDVENFSLSLLANFD
jgi:D-arabinitol dehydrogenase (NADP+)